MSWLYDYKAQFSLGILYLTTVLKEEGWDVEIYDTNVKSIEDIPLSDVFGFSMVFNTYVSGLKLAGFIKNKYSSSLIVAGGAHVTLSAGIDPIFDVSFKGEAENTIKIFTQDFKKNTVSSKYVSEIPTDLDTVYPDRSILPDEYIRTSSIFTDSLSYTSNGSTSIMFSRGCPYSCTFCASPKIYGRKVRFRSVESIVREIKDIVNVYGIRQFRVQDDTFTLNISYVRKLSSALKNLGIFYRCSTRVNHVNDESIRLLYESGCREIGIGIEAADNLVLEKLQKQITVEQAEEAIACIRKYPITLRCFFMVGTPFDSFELYEKNIAFIDKHKIENAMFANFIPFPGTDLYDRKEHYNILRVKEKTCMNIASHIELTPNILRTDMSEEDQLKILRAYYEYLLSKNFIK
jgi:radical SAM superfamily enzyme YgiQ (UPF0313 family)